MMRESVIAFMLLGLVFAAPKMAECGAAELPAERTAECRPYEITEEGASSSRGSRPTAEKPTWAAGLVGREFPSQSAQGADSSPQGASQEGAELVDLRWWTGEDAAIIAKVLLGECPYCGDRQQDLTAMCIINRVFQPNWNDGTVINAVRRPGQYCYEYTINLPSPDDPDETTQRAFAAAYRALNGQVECPRDVVYQANFPQGRGVYEVIEFESEWFNSTTWFCYG